MTDGLRLGEAATLTTCWGHQTQSLPGSRYRSSLGTSSLGLGEADIGYTLRDVRHRLCLAPSIGPPLGQMALVQVAATLATVLPRDIRHSLCLAPGVGPFLGHVARPEARRGYVICYSLGTSDTVFAWLQV